MNTLVIDFHFVALREAVCLGLNQMNLVRWDDLCYVGHVIESVSLVCLWMKFTSVELVKVT